MAATLRGSGSTSGRSDSVSRAGTSTIGMLFSSTATNGNYHGIVPLRPGHNFTKVTLTYVQQAGKTSAQYPPVSSFTARVIWDTLDIYTSLESVKGQFLAFDLKLE